jgi:tRNA (cmo5U34)-methyltransferase
VKQDASRDRVFARSLKDIKAFEFDESVADVFNDMISRSVPGYPLLLRLIGLFADIFIQPNTRVYDLGCSLGEATKIIASQSESSKPEIIAIDNSTAMIDKCRQVNLPGHNVEWRCEDVRNTQIENASMIVLNLTLQFLQPDHRSTLLQNIYQGLNPGGILFISEKIVFEQEAEDERMVQLYQAFKKSMGYSDLEISQKRTALENVLIPDSHEQHLERLQQAGFSEIYQCFRCFNFCAYLAIK